MTRGAFVSPKNYQHYQRKATADMKAELHIGRGKVVFGGVVVATVPRTVIEIDLDLDTLRGTIGGDVVVGDSETDEGQTQLISSGGAGGAKRTVPSEDVEAVWAHYVEKMKPRNTGLDPEKRTIILGALKVASVTECCRAIDGCESSDYHMKRGQHAHRNGAKYNSLGHIFKGRTRRGETTRDRIDMFLDRADASDVGVANLPSGDRAIVTQKVAEVRRAHRLPDDEEAGTKAKQAEEWLRRHGIEVVRDADGYPTFPRVGATAGGSA